MHTEETNTALNGQISAPKRTIRKINQKPAKITEKPINQVNPCKIMNETKANSCGVQMSNANQNEIEWQQLKGLINMVKMVFWSE
jgi:hypothetical protein